MTRLQQQFDRKTQDIVSFQVSRISPLEIFIPSHSALDHCYHTYTFTSDCWGRKWLFLQRNETPLHPTDDRVLLQIIFGCLSDRFGRKWPLIVNLILISAIELGSGFVQTFKQFLGVRSVFGIAMGGVWGIASSNALENLPVEVRGLASGVLQQAYAVGYLIAAVINLYLVPEGSAGWRSLFWTASGISLFAAVLRATLLESSVFIRARATRGADQTSLARSKIFIQEMKEMLRRHWMLCIYAILLMSGKSATHHSSVNQQNNTLTCAGLNFLAHGSQESQT